MSEKATPPAAEPAGPDEPTGAAPPTSAPPPGTAADELDRIAAEADPIHGRTLETDIQQAYKALSNSPWGQTLTGLFGNVKTRVQQVQQDPYGSVASVEAAVKSININDQFNKLNTGLNDFLGVTAASSADAGKGKETADTDRAVDDAQPAPHSPPPPESLPADIFKETSSILSKLTSTVASTALKQYEELRKREDEADEALMRFGNTVGTFLRDAATKIPAAVNEFTAGPDWPGQRPSPEGGAAAATEAGGSSTVLFESKAADGRRVFHSSRLEAQIHSIHASPDQSVLAVPDGPEFAAWEKSFGSAAAHTDAIAADLEAYPELRTALAGCVPDRIDADTFWLRYYFLRHVLAEDEAKRKALLRGAATSEHDLGWGSDSEADSEEGSDEGSDEEGEDDDDDEEDSDEEGTADAKPSKAPAAREGAGSPTATTAAADGAIADSYDIVSPGSCLSATEAAGKQAGSASGADATATAPAPAKGGSAKQGTASDSDSDGDWE